jgi:RNA polymerase sigma-70 factor (ECF subfamily)
VRKADTGTHVREAMIEGVETSASFEEVFETHLSYVWRVLRHLGIRDGDVEDAAQEAFMVVHRRLPEWRPEADIRTWLYAIAWRVAHRFRARERRRRAEPLETASETCTAESPADIATSRQELQRLEHALGAIDEDQRVVFVLYEIEGVEMHAIAEAVGCPLKTAYSRLRLARERVREQLSRSEGPHD